MGAVHLTGSEWNVLSCLWERSPQTVMELVEPDSLDRMMKSGPVMPGTVLNVGSQIAQGLKAAADVGMVHGDVKPGNLLLSAGGHRIILRRSVYAAARRPRRLTFMPWARPFFFCAPACLMPRARPCVCFWRIR